MLCHPAQTGSRSSAMSSAADSPLRVLAECMSDMPAVRWALPLYVPTTAPAQENRGPEQSAVLGSYWLGPKLD